MLQMEGMLLEVHSEKAIGGHPVVTLRAEGSNIEAQIGEMVSPLIYEAPFAIKGMVNWTVNGKAHSYQISEWSVMRIESLAEYLAEQVLESVKPVIHIPSASNFQATRKQNPIVRKIVEQAVANFQDEDGDRIKPAFKQAKEALFALESQYPGIADSDVIEAVMLRICYLLGDIYYVMNDD